MLIERRYQVFLSSTYDDLRLERQAATQSILAMGHLAAGMELFPASDLSQLDLIKRVIDESDYYVVIVAGRYGTIHEPSGLSFTEIEYDYAVENEVPILGFVARDIGQISSKNVDADEPKASALKAFRSKVLSKTCQLFDDPSDLGLKVMSSLTTETRINPRIGWVRADQARSAEDANRERELSADLANQTERVEELERQIRDKTIDLPDLFEKYAQGDDLTTLTARFQNNEKKVVLKKCDLSWDEIFSAIGAPMFGYIVRRAKLNYSDANETYTFEQNLKELVRTRIFEEVGQRTINLFPHEIDSLLIQYKQLGYIEMAEQKGEKETFRGFRLTELGEQKLTQLSSRISA